MYLALSQEGGGGDEAYIILPIAPPFIIKSCLAGHSTVTIVYKGNLSEDQGSQLFMKAETRRYGNLAWPKTIRDVVNPDFRNAGKGIGCLDCS